MIYLLFILGTILGSFFLVVGTRLPLKENIITSRSKCDNCDYTLKWYNLIPLISFIFQRGRCTGCKNKIAIEHIIVEIFMGLGFSLLYLFFGFGYLFWGGLIIYSLLIIIIITDMKYMIILDSPLIITTLLFLIIQIIYLESYQEILVSFVSGISLFLLMYGIKLLGDLIFKRESLGGGDIKLSFVIGYILGFRLSLIALILSSFLALPASTLSLFNKNKEVPYGPFLTGSLFIVFIFADKFINMLSYFIL